MLASPIASAIAGHISGLIPGGELIARSQLRLQQEGLVGSASTTAWNNSGLLGSVFDFDVAGGTLVNRKPHPSDSVLLYGVSGDFASTPDSAAADISGDITLLAKINCDDYITGSSQNIITKWTTAGNMRCYRIFISGTGQLGLSVSDDGSFDAADEKTAALGATDGNDVWVMATWVASTGTVNLYKSFDTTNDPDAVTFTNIGTGTTTANSINLNDVDVLVGAVGGGTSQLLAGHIHIAQILNGIDVPPVIEFNAADYVNRTSSTEFPSSATGEVWILNGNSFIQNTGQRGVHTIGSSFLRTALAQDIEQFSTLFAVAQFNPVPAGNSHIFDALATSGKSTYIRSASGASYQAFAGSNITVSQAVDTEVRLHSFRVNGTTSFYEVSGVGSVSGDAGSNAWEVGTIMANLSGAETLEGALYTLVGFEDPLNDSEFAIAQGLLLNKYRLAA